MEIDVRLLLIKRFKLFSVALVLATTACSTVTPASFNAKAPAVSIRATAPVSVQAQLTGSSASRFNANGFTFGVDLDAFSSELARLLVKSLRDAGVQIPGEREIHVQVIYIDFMFQGPCILDYNVSLGANGPFGMQSRGDSSNFAIACRAAMEQAVTDIVADSRTAQFLGGE